MSRYGLCEACLENDATEADGMCDDCFADAASADTTDNAGWAEDAHDIQLQNESRGN